MKEDTFVLVNNAHLTLWYKLKGKKLYDRYNGYILNSDIKILKTTRASSWSELDWSQTSLVISESEVGWLDRSGHFYGCDPKHHDDYAEYILGKSVGELEQAGWVRIYGPPKYYTTFVCLYRLGPSAEQRNWLLSHGYDLSLYD